MAELVLFECERCGTKRMARSLAEFEDHYCPNPAPAPLAPSVGPSVALRNGRSFARDWSSLGSAADTPATAFRERQWAKDLLSQSKTSVTATQRLVALALMLHVDWRSLQAWPGVEVLARECGLERKAVGRALSALRRKGWVWRVTRGDWRTKQADVLELIWPKWWKPEFTPSGPESPTADDV